MQPVLESTIDVLPSGKPILNSYDSAEECSFHHWIELCKLVDESDDQELEEPVELTASEV
ncbi:MAG TPA: hypothetical protein VGR47_11650 [Terracidiphilus sp.]|nr:hypothetical protein [Terracidiphilus sp.]